MIRLFKRFWCAFIDRHDWMMNAQDRVDAAGRPRIWCQRCDTEVDI